MRRRQLLLWHTGLVVAALLLGWRLAAEWRHTNQLRYAASVPPSSASIAPLAPGVANQSLVFPGEIVAKNLFSPDRTSELAQPPAQQRPVSPLPVVFGTMKLGQHYEALMAESEPGGSRAFRRMKKGERLGDYTVVEIRENQVEVEYQGQRSTLDVYQSANSVPRRQAAAAPAARPVVESAGSAPSQPSPSAQQPPRSVPPTIPTGSSAATQPDPYTRITIEGNRRKVERQTPFGTQVWYEEIR